MNHSIPKPDPNYVPDHDSLDLSILSLVNSKYGWDFNAMRLHLMAQQPRVKPSKLKSRFDALYSERFEVR